MKIEWRVSSSVRPLSIFIFFLTKVSICLTNTYLDNPLHSLDSNFVFTTEGHPIHLSHKIQPSVPSDKPAPTCQVPPTSTRFMSGLLSIPDVFHSFTSNTTLNSLFIPYLDTRSFSTPRTILEVIKTHPSLTV